MTSRRPLHPVPAVPGWRAWAACAGSDPEMFYPLDPEDAAQAAAARAVCARCPVRAACLAEAMAVEDPARRWGITGATTPRERTALHRARPMATGGAAA